VDGGLRRRDEVRDAGELAGLEQRLTELLGRNVGLLPEPIGHPRLRANVYRARRRAF
jgi:predicted nucleotidyltransferase